MTLSSAGLVFGPQDEGTTSPSQGLTVFNTSDVPVTIFGTSVTGTAYTDYAASGCIATVYPGGSCSVRVNFSPTATGSRAATVNLADSTTARSHSFTVTGTGVAPTLTLSINPTAVTFADLAVGATSTPALLVQVTNTGNAIVPIDRVSTTGDFRISNTSCVTNLRVGSTCSISVEFTPTADRSALWQDHHRGCRHWEPAKRRSFRQRHRRRSGSDCPRPTVSASAPRHKAPLPPLPQSVSDQYRQLALRRIESVHHWRQRR